MTVGSQCREKMLHSRSYIMAPVITWTISMPFHTTTAAARSTGVPKTGLNLVTMAMLHQERSIFPEIHLCLNIGEDLGMRYIAMLTLQVQLRLRWHSTTQLQVILLTGAWSRF